MSYTTMNRVDVIPSSGTATDNGTMFLTALSTAKSGDLIVLGPGYYDTGDTRAQVVIPAGVSITGTGMFSTYIQNQWGVASSFTCNFLMGDGSSLSNLTIDLNKKHASNFQYGVGPANGASVALESVRILGGSDGIYTQVATGAVVTNATIKMYNCIVVTGYDAVNLGSSVGILNLLEAYNCIFDAQYGVYSQTSGVLRAVNVEGTNYAKLWNCRLTAKGRSTSVCLRTSSTTPVEAHGCTFDVGVLGTSDYCDVYAEGNGTKIFVDRCSGTGPLGSVIPKTSGTGVVNFTAAPSMNVIDASSLAAESLAAADAALTTATTNFVPAGEFALSPTDAASYTFASTGAGTLTLAGASLGVALVPNAWYKLDYTPAATPTIAPLTCATVALAGGTSVPLDFSVTTATKRSLYLKAGATGDLVFTVAGATAGAFTLNTLSLKQVTGGSVMATAAVTASSTGNKIAVTTYANDGAAATGGLAVGDIYAVTGTGVVMRRAT